MRVLIIDDHAIVRRGMISLLRDYYEDIEFGEAEDARQGLAAATGAPWDLVMVDISMPGRSGLDFLQDLRAAKPELRVLVISAHPE